tara:strand:+ start:358 stop:948 length:591 start_codon:yes stop_codon:yes gene_type:complete
MNRGNLIIYRSFYEAIDELPAENQAILWKAVFELGLNGVEIELSGINSTIFKLIKPQIDANIRRYNNGKIPKDKQNESKNEAKQEQKTSESEANKNKNKNNNKNLNNNKDTLEIRKSNFYKYLSESIKDYPKDMLREFYEYWSEHGVNDRKMRFEKEKTFGVSRRLKTWFNNSGDKYVKAGLDPLVIHVQNQLKND